MKNTNLKFNGRSSLLMLMVCTATSLSIAQTGGNKVNSGGPIGEGATAPSPPPPILPKEHLPYSVGVWKQSGGLNQPTSFCVRVAALSPATQAQPVLVPSFGYYVEQEVSLDQCPNTAKRISAAPSGSPTARKNATPNSGPKSSMKCIERKWEVVPATLVPQAQTFSTGTTNPKTTSNGMALSSQATYCGSAVLKSGLLFGLRQASSSFNYEGVPVNFPPTQSVQTTQVGLANEVNAMTLKPPILPASIGSPVLIKPNPKN